MKYLSRLIPFIVAVVMVSTACEPMEYGELGEPFSKIDGIEGTWVATEVIQVDETALAQGGLYTEMDLTNVFNFTNYTITFATASGQPSTFTVSPGGAPSFIDTTGTWAFDDSQYPTQVHFTLPDSSEYTSMMRLVAPPREQNPLRIKFQRFSGGKLIVSYRYTFEKQNP